MNQNMMSIEETSFSVESPRIAGVATGGFLLIIFCSYWRNEHDANLVLISCACGVLFLFLVTLKYL